MREKHLESIKEAVRLANPELGYRHMDEDEGDDIIRLADVILAVKESLSHFSSWKKTTNVLDKLLIPNYVNGKFIHDPFWNLRKDSLEDQSDECLQFLASILTGDTV